MEILDFPCNQFLGQAPGTDAEIVSFCQLKYGVSFKTFSKIDVNGKNAEPLFTFLKNNAPKTSEKKPGLTNWFGGNKIKWNFTKFLIDRDGFVIARFEPMVKPEAIEPYIANLLK